MVSAAEPLESSESPAAADPPGTTEAAIGEAVERGFPSAVSALGRLVRIPSVSFPGFDQQQVRRSAEAVAELVRELAVFDAVSIEAVGDGAPAVIATRAARHDRPTVLLYAHHDVQPPGPDEAWTTPAFEPTLVDGRLRGRGASDDKSGVVTHLAAVRAFIEATGDTDLGISLFIEGEEENGSPSFDAFLAAHREQLAADVIVVADSDNPSTRVPGITASLRGNVTFTLQVSTLGSPSHSGQFGGAAPDATLAAITLLATLWDETGAVAVPGLEPSVPPTEQTPEDDAAFAAEADLLPGVRPIGHGSIDDRLWRGPSITVTGIDAPDVRNASNTLAASVRVKISARIAPGTGAADAYAALRAHLEAKAPFGAHLAFGDADLGEAFLVDTSGWAVEDVTAALRAGWGAEPVFTGIGGSIPFVATLAATYPKAQILVTGVEDPASKAHAPDESQSLEVLHSAIRSEAYLLLSASRRTLGA